MRNVVDASGWLEFLAGGPGARHFRAPLLDRSQLIVPSLTIFEVTRVLRRERGEEIALQVAASMRSGHVIGLDADLAVFASELSIVEHLAMGDSVTLATARWHSATLWTQDIDFEGKANVRYFPKDRR